jgi:hypothetical protein
MFIPETSFSPPKGSLTVIHHNEPMQRGNGNAHYAQDLYRQGGRKVYVSSLSQRTMNGISEKEYQKLITKNPTAKKYNWSNRVLDPTVYVRGKISHKEHKTLDLGSVWHRTYLNTEDKARAARNVSFLD